MNPSTQTLATNPPPSWRFTRLNEASARIADLERQLGLPAGETIYNIGRANARIHELEAMAAKLTPPPAPVAAAAQAPSRPSILQRYDQIKDHRDRASFYLANREAVDAAFHEMRRPAPPAAVTKPAILSEYERIEDAGERVTFYREHSAEIDRAFRQLNKEQ